MNIIFPVRKLSRQNLLEHIKLSLTGYRNSPNTPIPLPPPHPPPQPQKNLGVGPKLVHQTVKDWLRCRNIA